MADSALPSTLCESTPPPMADADLSLHAPCEPSSSNPTPSDQVESESLTGTVDRWDEHVRSPLRSGSVSCSVVKTSDESGSTRNGESSAGAKSLEDHVREWKEKRAMDGVAAMDYALPFLTNDPKLMECRLCFKGIYTGEEIRCTVSGCQSAFHLNCAENTLKLSNEKISSKDELNNSKKGSKDPKFERLRFKCPLHGCFVCKQIGYWRCVKCVIASHNKCAPWKEDVMFLPDQHALAVCWKHPSNWLHQNQHTDVTQSIQEVFARLPVPYFEEEFSFNNDDVAENINEPTRFDRIRRNIYHIKRKRESHTGVGCRSCTSDSTCKDDCECRGVSVSCSKACHCSDFCTNKPFRKDKKIKIVKTENCGWGVITLEPLEKGDFIVEYIGEVIDDRTCEKRLWDIKKRGDFNFYMCEISKDFTIDATFKGNTSRFLNHSCDPNCKLEKWQVEGETRVGVFASRSIKTGEPLTYDYRFVHFGPMVVCKCGATNCQGFLGSKKIAHQEPFNTEVLTLEEILPDSVGKNFVWGQKTKRSELVKTTNQSLLSNGSQIFQNQFDLVETPQELPPIPIKEDPPLSWGRRIKRSYTVSVDQNGSGGN